MVFYILAVAVLNLGLGFAVAVHLARRCRPLGDLPGGFSMPGVTSLMSDSGTGGLAGLSDVSLAADLGQTTIDSTPGQDASLWSPTITRTGQEGPGAKPQPGDTSGKDSVEGFQKHADHYQQRLVKLDDQLRDCAESPEPETIESLLQSLRDASREFLQHREQAHGTFKSLHEGREQFSVVCDGIQMAMDEQDMQIENTEGAINSFDYGADLKTGCHEMVDETGKLLDANHHVRNALDDAMVAVARHELSPEAMDPAMWKDELTGIANRLGLEAELSKWWEDDPQRELPLNAAMIDIDHFSQINEQHGHTTGNEILRAVAQLLNAEIGSRGTAGRFCGQQFLLLLPNADARGATNLTEKIRQTLEIAHFQRQDLDIQVTVSCGVSKSTPEDTSDTLFARAEATLQEAKRYGDNRTFLREGNYPTPVVPPSFALEEKTISL